jgi:hypothetical protein
MRKLLILLLLAPPVLATDILNTTSAPAVSTCPTSTRAGCDSGWFTVTGARVVVLDVIADKGTNTVLVERRPDSGGAISVLKTLTNVGPNETGYSVQPPAGDIRLRVTAVGGSGRVSGKLTAVSANGTVLW